MLLKMFRLPWCIIHKYILSYDFHSDNIYVKNLFLIFCCIHLFRAMKQGASLASFAKRPRLKGPEEESQMKAPEPHSEPNVSQENQDLREKVAQLEAELRQVTYDHV